MKKLKLTTVCSRPAMEVLKQIGVNFEPYGGIIPVDIDSDRAMMEICNKIISESDEKTIVLVAETGIYLKDERLGVPGNKEEAAEQLKKLSGKTHRFITRMCIGGAGEPPETAVCETKVAMKEIKEWEVRGYLSMCDFRYPGAYDLTGPGSFFVRSVQGDFNNIKGMPVSVLMELLNNKYGISIVNGKNIFAKGSTEK